MLNLNSADFTTPKKSSKILILKIEILLEFQNMTNIEIIGFLLMQFGLELHYSFMIVLELYSIIVLLDTHLDLLDTDIPRYVFKTSCKMSSRRLG